MYFTFMQTLKIGKPSTHAGMSKNTLENNKHIAYSICEALGQPFLQTQILFSPIDP